MAHYIILAFPHHIPIMIGFMPVAYIRAGYCGIAEEGGDKDSGVRGASWKTAEFKKQKFMLERQ